MAHDLLNHAPMKNTNTSTFMRLSWLGLICIVCSASQAEAPPSIAPGPPVIQLPASIEQLAPAQTAQWLTAHPDAVIIDLRMPPEIQREGRIAGSKNYDFLQSTTAEKLAQLDPTKPYLLYCALGGRSQKAAVQLHSKGFQKLALLQGGLDAWIKAGQPVSP